MLTTAPPPTHLEAERRQAVSEVGAARRQLTQARDHAAELDREILAGGTVSGADLTEAIGAVTVAERVLEGAQLKLQAAERAIRGAKERAGEARRRKARDAAVRERAAGQPEPVADGVEVVARIHGNGLAVDVCPFCAKTHVFPWTGERAPFTRPANCKGGAYMITRVLA